MVAKAKKNIAARAPVPVAAAAKKEPRKFVDYTVFGTSGRVEKPLGTVTDFGSCEALKSAFYRECQQSGANPPTFRIVERDFDESRSADSQLQETEVN
jgi:hypothetical protein